MSDGRSVLTGGSPLPADVDGTVITVGSFDGVHLGHRDVLARVTARARELGLRSVLVTFEPHPLRVVNPSKAPLLLTTCEEKLEALATTGIEFVALVPFTPALARLDAERFVDLVLRERFRLSHLVMGYDHGFGRDRAGDVDLLRVLGRDRGFGVEVVSPVLFDGDHAIGSSGIRKAIAAGDLGTARLALGRPYSASGRVTHGEQRGRGLGFPTINVAVPTTVKLLPPTGVYAVRVQTPHGAFGGMMNLGPRPTFGESEVRLEAHLFDAAGDFYGAPVRIDFVSRLRETMRFESPDALVAQLHDDAIRAHAALRADGTPPTSADSVDSTAERR